MSAKVSAGGLPLEPIEHASLDELRALQLDRRRGTLAKAYDRVPHYRPAFDAAGARAGEIEELLLQRPGMAPHYVCELDRKGPLDQLTVRVELKPGHTDQAATTGATPALGHAIKSNAGVAACVIAGQPGRIERSMGNARRVIDRRPHN